MIKLLNTTSTIGAKHKLDQVKIAIYDHLPTLYNTPLQNRTETSPQTYYIKKSSPSSQIAGTHVKHYIYSYTTKILCNILALYTLCRRISGTPTDKLV